MGWKGVCYEHRCFKVADAHRSQKQDIYIHVFDFMDVVEST